MHGPPCRRHNPHISLVQLPIPRIEQPRRRQIGERPDLGRWDLGIRTLPSLYWLHCANEVDWCDHYHKEGGCCVEKARDQWCGWLGLHGAVAQHYTAHTRDRRQSTCPLECDERITLAST